MIKGKNLINVRERTEGEKRAKRVRSERKMSNSEINARKEELTCMIPMQGKTQVQLAGRTSLSAQHMNSSTL